MGELLDSIRAIDERRKKNGTGHICRTCKNLVRVTDTVIGCEAHDKMILPMFPPFHDGSEKGCPEWKEREGL